MIPEEGRKLRMTAYRKVIDVEKLARTEPRLASPTSRWDSDDWLLNTPTGVVDLKTAYPSPSDPSLMITRITSAGPDEDYPLWTSLSAPKPGGECVAEELAEREELKSNLLSQSCAVFRYVPPPDRHSPYASAA